MSSSSKLEELVEGLRGEAHFDSVGEFTLSLEEAVSRIRREAQLQPAGWLLRAAQGAVVESARSFSASLGPNRASLKLTLGAGWERLEDPQFLLSGQAGFEDWKQTILWARALQPQSLDIVFTSPQKGYLLSLEGDRTLLTASPSGPEPMLQVLLRFGQRDTARTAELSHSVAHRLRFFPISACLDGFSLNQGQFTSTEPGIYAQYLLASSSEEARLALISPCQLPALAYQVAGAQPVRRGRSGEPFPRCKWLEFARTDGTPMRLNSTPCSLGMSFEVARWQEQGVERQIYLNGANKVPLPEPLNHTKVAARGFFFRGYQGPSQLWLVRQGVLLQPVELSMFEPDSWQVVLASQRIATDLSGLNVVENDEFDLLKDWVVGYLRDVYRRFHGKHA